MAAGYDGPVAIAVSGGSDSLALMHLADLWSRETGRTLHILTVDHGLRPEAAAEARWVMEAAQALGHSGEILRWSPEKTGQQAARRARHEFIARAARQSGARLVLFGHTRTDVQETLLMRLARASSLTGAVGPVALSVSPVWPAGRDVQAGRPLAGTHRSHLMTWLTSHEKIWISDPSNEAEIYERPRIRKLLQHLDSDRVDRITGDAMRLRAFEDGRLAVALDHHVKVAPSGLVELDGLPASPRIRWRLLSLVLQLAAGSDRPVATQALQALEAGIATGGPESRLTLGGAWLQRHGDRFMVGRDPGEAHLSWREELWDGRYIAAPGAHRPEDVPFLVRASVPAGGGWREIVSERLEAWIRALGSGARFGAILADPDSNSPYQTPRLRPAHR